MKALILAALVTVAAFTPDGHTSEIKAQHGDVITPKKSWCGAETFIMPLSGKGEVLHSYVEKGVFKQTPVDYHYTLRTETEKGYTLRLEPSLKEDHNIAGALALTEDALEAILRTSLFIPVQYTCGSLTGLNKG
jgi:hypothetical protein